MIHAAVPHFLWPFAVWYAVHQLNLWPRVSLPETSPTLRWTEEVGDASVFRVWGSRAFVCDTYADKLSARAIPCVFLGFPPDAHVWQFYHPTSRRVFPSQDVTCCLRCCVWGAEPGGAEPGGVEPGGAESKGVGSGGAEPRGAELGGAEPEGVEPGVLSLRVRSLGVLCLGVLLRREVLLVRHRDCLPDQSISPCSSYVSGLFGTHAFGLELPELEVLELLLKGTGVAGTGGVGGAGAGGTGAGARGAGAGGFGAGGTGAGGAGAVDPGAGGDGAGGAGGTVAGGTVRPRPAGGAGGTTATGPGGARTKGTRAAGTGGVEGARAGDPTEHGTVGAVDPGAGGAGDTVRRRPYFVPLLQQVLGVLSSNSLTPTLLCPPPDQSQLPLQPASPLPAPSPYTEQSGGLTERREPASRPVSPVLTARRVPRLRPPPVPCTHAMALRPSSVPLRVPLMPPPESSLAAVPDLGSDLSTAASALVAELLDFAAASRLDYATFLVAESESASPPSVRGKCALGTDVLEDRQEDFECLAAAVPCFASMLLAPEGDLEAPDIPTPRSYAEAITGTYVDAVPPSRTNIVDGMWIFRVKRPPGSPPAFKARYVARGFSQRQGVDYFQTFSPTPKMTTLRVLLHVVSEC
ncbi:unnamed protein product [Closterium sp. NIES-53]